MDLAIRHANDDFGNTIHKCKSICPNQFLLSLKGFAIYTDVSVLPHFLPQKLFTPTPGLSLRTVASWASFYHHFMHDCAKKICT